MANLQNKLSRLRKTIRSRLTAAPGTVSLDARIDEEVEDSVIAFGLSGERDLLARVLDDLIGDYFRNPDLYPVEEGRAFLLRALRVCDFLQHERFRATLKLILLSDDRSTWGGPTLDELKSLAARALIGLSKTTKDLHFWQEVAEQCSLALPYALRATFEIDLQEGCTLFWRMYLRPGLRGDNPYVDWSAILDAADEIYSAGDYIAAALERAFVIVSDLKDPLDYEKMVHNELKVPRYSRIGKRTIAEVGIGYDQPSHLRITVEPELYKDIRLATVSKPSMMGQGGGDAVAHFVLPQMQAAPASWYARPN